MKNKLIKFCISLAILASISSCIAVKKNNIPKVESDNVKIFSEKKFKVFIDWNFKSSMATQSKQNVIDQLKSSNKKLLSEAINESNCCIIVDEKDESDIKINGTFYNDSSDTGIYFAYLTGFSFGIIPSWINAKSKISAEVGKGSITNNYIIEDSLLIAQWLPFLVAMPFRSSPIKDEAECNKNLYRNLILKMKEDGIFKK